MSTLGDPEPVLPIRGERLVVERGGRQVVAGVGIEIGRAPGLSAILGPNGAGKSLLLKLLVNLLSPDTGRVTWAGSVPDRLRATRIGFVFQRPVMLRRSALENIVFALAAGGIEVGARRRMAEEALVAARLAHLAARPARSLSGGEQQRLAVARALALSPDVLFLDEPTANLDPASTDELEAMMRTASAKKPVVLVTHDLAQARRVATRVLFMHKGRLLEEAPRDEFFEAPRTPEAQAYLRGEIVL